jgi:hypothetical protein
MARSDVGRISATVPGLQTDSLCGMTLEKLIVSQLIQKFSDFYGTQKFTTVFTISVHWALS